jgi:GMP synthase (glutamine-hydrolysing)
MFGGLDARAVYRRRNRKNPAHRRRNGSRRLRFERGVDSTVAAALVHEAIGERQTCIFVNNGLLRDDEYATTLALYEKEMHLNVRGVDASEEFYSVLKDVSDPELKRKAIGAKFIDVFRRRSQ